MYQGLVHTYCHLGRIGVAVEMTCTTDFCARTDAFKLVCRDVAMHIAAMAPVDVTELLDQKFIKSETWKVSELIQHLQDELGEPVKIRRFARFEIGVGDE